MKEITVTITDDKEKEIIKEALTTYRKEKVRQEKINIAKTQFAFMIAEIINNIGIEETERIIREGERKLRETQQEIEND